MGEEKENGEAPRQLLERPKDAPELRAWVEHELQLKLPKEAVCAHHQSPFEYLKCAFFERARDIVVWARAAEEKRAWAQSPRSSICFSSQSVRCEFLAGRSSKVCACGNTSARTCKSWPNRRFTKAAARGASILRMAHPPPFCLNHSAPCAAARAEITLRRSGNVRTGDLGSRAIDRPLARRDQRHDRSLSTMHQPAD